MKNIKRILSLLLVFVFLFTLFGCNKVEEFSFYTEGQANYLAGDYKLIRSYAKGEEELSKPNPIKLSWDLKDDNNNYKFNLSLNEDMTDSVIYEIKTNEIELLNLKINLNYYWFVEYVDLNVKSKINSFIINTNGPRNLDIDGVTNVRDLGGYLIGESYTNQGLIYRSARFNENETTTNLITDKGINQMVNDLKIKTELDIRKTEDNENGGLTTSPLGDSVNYISIPMKTGGNYLMLNTGVLKDIFSVFGNKDNYPIVMHCSIGTDRTGALAFLINSLLGATEDILYRDYLFSNFGNIGGFRSPSTIEDYIRMINREKGDTFAIKTRNYLISYGVNESDIDNLIDIMTN